MVSRTILSITEGILLFFGGIKLILTDIIYAHCSSFHDKHVIGMKHLALMFYINIYFQYHLLITERIGIIFKD